MHSLCAHQGGPAGAKPWRSALRAQRGAPVRSLVSELAISGTSNKIAMALLVGAIEVCRTLQIHPGRYDFISLAIPST